MSKLILASQSPRRKELLSGLGIVFDVVPADVDEQRFAGEAYAAYVKRVAGDKAALIAERYADRPVLSADTTVVSPSGDILEKPSDKQDIERMMQLLQNTTHLVATAFCLHWREKQIKETHLIETKVSMLPLSKEAIAAYANTGEGLDKAGGYAVQGIGAAFVSRIDGSYTNVVGLPLSEVITVLTRIGVWDLSQLTKSC